MEYTKINNPMNDTENNVVTNEKIESLAKLFPEVVKDGEIDFKALKEELGKFDEVGTEKFELTWAGKQNAKKKYLENVSNRTLKFLENDSKNPNETENLYIEGDNLEVLKLLRKNYYNSIKMIYIDPPYNTDKDFIYNDSFKMSQEESNKIEGYIGFDNEKLEKVSQSSNRYHANWLNMMYPRLKTARDLLTDDGVILISIDDNEVDNLKKICNEIYGEENQLPPNYIQVRYLEKNLTEGKIFKPLLENILIYAKNINEVKFNRPTEEYTDDKFCFEINELCDGEKVTIGRDEVTIFKKGEWELNKNSHSSKSFLKETWITGSIYTNMSYGEVFKRVVEPRIEVDGLSCLYKVHGRGEDGLGYRYYTGPQKQGATKGKMYSGMPLSRIEEIKKEGISLKYLPISTFYDYAADFGNIKHEGGIGFNSGKKPIKLLKQLIKLLYTENSIILDFFSGSASTAHAVMQLNAEDGGNRKFIMVQLDELTYTGKKEKYKDKNGEQKEKYIIDDITGFPIVVKDSDARKSGYYTIPQIGRARIDNAGEQIKKEIEANNNNLKLGEEPKKVPDIGFKTLKTGNTNIKWNRLTNIIGENLTFAHNNDPDSMDFELATKDIDVVYELMLLQRDLPLSEKVITLDDIGSRVYLYANSYLVCLETQITDEIIEKIASINPIPIKFFFRDSAFGNDIFLKDNIFNKFERIIEKNSISNKKTYTVEFI